MTRFLLALCCCSCLLSPMAPRAEPERQAAYIVWMGGDDHDDVASARTHWDAERDALRSVLQVAPGYPVLRESRLHPELPKGQSWLVIGVCSVPDAEKLLPMLQGLRSTVRIEKVQTTLPLACPSPVGGWTTTIGDGEVTLEATLEVVRLRRQDPATRLPQELVLVFHRAGPGGQLLESREILLPPSCTAELVWDEDVIDVVRTCPDGGRQERGFTILDGKLADKAELYVPRAVVWATADTEAAATEALAAWEREKAGLSGLVNLPPGYPKVRGPRELAGLAPGHSIVLGVCSLRQLGVAAEALRVFDGRIQLRPVTSGTGALACPQGVDGLRVQSTEHGHAYRSELTFVTFEHGDEGEWELRVYLRGEDGALVDWRREDRETVRGRVGGDAMCDFRPNVFADPALDEPAFVVSFACEVPVGTKAFRMVDAMTTYRARGGALVSSEKIWKEPVKLRKK